MAPNEISLRDQPKYIAESFAKMMGIKNSQALEHLQNLIKQAMVQAVIVTKDECISAVFSSGVAAPDLIIGKIEEVVPTTSISAGVMD